MELSMSGYPVSKFPERGHLGRLVGASPRMQKLYDRIHRAAHSSSTVLIGGESGSGKELVAMTLHELSGRSGPMIVFDASVADREMMRSDLFGHVKGAFTGSLGSREGAFRSADGGTLFIDEIGELPIELQPRLLRVLENREVTPVGSDRSIKIDVRILAATHRDINAMVQAGSFRADLFHRLSILPIRLPPLREIKPDLPLLVRHLCRELSLTGDVSTAAMEALVNYDWPGNVRELRNVLEHAALYADSVITPENLHLEDRISMIDTTKSINLPQLTPIETPSRTLHDIERNVILQTVEKNQYNKTATARELGISVSTLKRKLKLYDSSLGG